LRFQGFEGEWEEKKLGEVIEFKVTNSLSRENLNYEIGTVKNIHYGDIHTKFQTLFDTNQEVIPYINEEINIDRISEDNYCKNGDIVFADASEDLNDVGKSIEVVNVNGEKLLSGLHTLLGRPKEHIFSLGFNGYLFKSNFVRTQIQKQSQGSKVLSVNTGRLLTISLIFPHTQEQEKITSLLKLIDQRIQTQSKIIEGLKVQMLGLQEQIFRRKIKLKDKQGNEFPEWEFKKMKELFKFKITNSLSREQLNYKNGIVKNIHYGDIHTKFHTLFDIQKEEAPYINTEVNIDRINDENYCVIGDVIFADASENLIDVGKSIEIVNLNNQKLLAGLHTILARPNSRTFSIGFCGYLFKSDYVKSQIQKESQGSKVLSISAVRLSKVSLTIPCIDEQTKIVNFLSSIDTKIDIENRLLNKLEEQKKFLQQQMFV
jgi:type I restriction enzyme S subunit